MKRAELTSPKYKGMTGEVISVCTDGQYPVAKIKLDKDGSFVFMFMDEFTVIEEKQ